jgi:hypothetical protein
VIVFTVHVHLEKGDPYFSLWNGGPKIKTSEDELMPLLEWLEYEAIPALEKLVPPLDSIHWN